MVNVALFGSIHHPFRVCHRLAFCNRFHKSVPFDSMDLAVVVDLGLQIIDRHKVVSSTRTARSRVQCLRWSVKVEIVVPSLYWACMHVRQPYL